MTPVEAHDYALLDCGRGRKLERLGQVLLDRPVAHAAWTPEHGPELWSRADGVYHRSDKGGGHWDWRRPVPESWEVDFGGLRLRIKPTPFGHLGLFPEQRANWDWLRGQVKRLGDCEVLNLFAYTGGSTLAAAQAGARVCHVDSSKGVVGWARDNAALSGLAERPVRWIVEDAVAFLRREVRRGRRYQGLIMDPPSYGRGLKGQVFKIEDDLAELLSLGWELLGDSPGFFLLSCHSASFTPRVLAQVLARSAPGPGELDAGEMVVPGDEGGPDLPGGVLARWWR